PFILAGGGALSSFSRNQDQLRDQTVGVFHVGTGLKLDLSERFGLRLDGRMLLPPDIKMTMAPDWEVLAGLYLRLGLGRPEPKDSDGDGVMDPADKCPNEKGLSELSGCPDKDDDGDGVLNLQDKCPTQPGVRELFGCPDKDGDGIPDGQDKCPDKPETKNNYQDEDGCPDEIPRAVKRFTGVIQGINFVANKYDILPSSFGVLDQAVKVLTEYPDVKLEIQGHTDTSGQLEMNRELSQKRAEAVKAYLVQKGIAPERLRAVGYGPDKPLADNKTAAGRARNRRVEFQLITTTEVPPPPEAPPQEKTPE
ncbi:MAG: OmpA family protein, partial [Myxococcota bacterium]|nr:OmpA family protein [Myxococcota bacterium]